MEIKRETTITAYTTDEKPLEIGKTYVFDAEGKCFTGKYAGISKRGALMFKGMIAGTDVTWNVMPKSVTEIYLADVEVVDYMPFKRKESEDE